MGKSNGLIIIQTPLWGEKRAAVLISDAWNASNYNIAEIIQGLIVMSHEVHGHLKEEWVHEADDWRFNLLEDEIRAMFYAASVDFPNTSCCNIEPNQGKVIYNLVDEIKCGCQLMW